MKVPIFAAAVLMAELSWASPCRAQEEPAASPPDPPTEQPGELGEGPRRPRLHVDYFAYGVAVSADLLADPGATCRQESGLPTPCILGSGGGLVLRAGYRSSGPWYVGGAYQFSATDSDNLYRLGTLQQLRAEMRYIFDVGYRTAPYVTWGVGGAIYGNEWGVETGGGSAFLGGGFETQLSRLVLLGMGIHYQPVVFAGFTDTAGFDRDPGLAHYFRIELQLEIRSELSRQ